MHEQLEAIKTAWDKESGERDEDLARELSAEFVETYPERYVDIRNKSVVELAKAVDIFREAGFYEKQWEIEAWLLYQYDPQDIGGSAEPRVRNHDG